MGAREPRFAQDGGNGARRAPHRLREFLLRHTTLLVELKDALVAPVAPLFGLSLRFHALHHALRSEEMKVEHLLLRESKQASEGAGLQDVVALLAFHVGHVVHGTDDIPQLRLGERRGELSVERAKALKRIGSGIDLDSRVVEHEAHQLARSLAIEVSVRLEFGDLVQPRHHKRMEMEDGGRALAPHARQRRLRRLSRLVGSQVREMTIVLVGAHQGGIASRFAIVRSRDAGYARVVENSAIHLDAGNACKKLVQHIGKPLLHVLEEADALFVDIA